MYGIMQPNSKIVTNICYIWDSSKQSLEMFSTSEVSIITFKTEGWPVRKTALQIRIQTNACMIQVFMIKSYCETILTGLSPRQDAKSKTDKENNRKEGKHGRSWGRVMFQENMTDYTSVKYELTLSFELMTFFLFPSITANGVH